MTCMRLCPADAPSHAFYLKVLQPSRVSDTCWYSKNPLGHNPLHKTVSRLCSAAGIGGFKTNHSLRATSTSRLYQSGVEEQMVMERTGHRSVDGVRSYKRTSDEQRMTLSDILTRKPATNTHSTTSHPSTSHLHNTTGALTGIYNLQSSSFTNCSITFYGAQTAWNNRKREDRPSSTTLTPTGRHVLLTELCYTHRTHARTTL